MRISYKYTYIPSLWCLLPVTPSIPEAPLFLNCFSHLSRKPREPQPSSAWFPSGADFPPGVLLCLHIWGSASWEVWQHVRPYILKTALQKRPRLADLLTYPACLFSGAAILNHSRSTGLGRLNAELFKKFQAGYITAPLTPYH